MQIIKTDLSKTGFFSDLFLDYLSQKNNIKNFYDLFPEEGNFSIKAQSLNFPSERRVVLYQSLLNQYNCFDIKEEVKENLELLKKENTFTITTGHQLNIFSGPLYFIYKIVTVINAAKKLNEANKDLHFIPVYWMATEDHDFEEINNFNLFNKKYTWETDQKGPVGRFATEGFDKIFSQINEVLPLFEKAYLHHKNLSSATRYFVNELFGKDGLLILNGDDRDFKNEFSVIIKDELLNNTSYKKVAEASESISQLGYKSQVHAREINLFYIETGLRERIVKEDGVFKVLNTDIKFSEEEILSVLKTNPEKFSPNVILRPVYQQQILPNVCYCGGPAEVAYWMQLKSTCDYYKVSFPILIPRNFVLFINKQNFKKLEKTGLPPEELFEPDHKLKSKIIDELTGDGYKLEEEIKALDPVFKSMKEKASKIDVTLEGFVAAEYQKALKIMEGVEKKFKKAEENKNEILISQILNLKAKLFPEGELQERSDNFLNFYINDPYFINKILNVTDPFDFKFNIIMDNE